MPVDCRMSNFIEVGRFSCESSSCLAKGTSSLGALCHPVSLSDGIAFSLEGGNNLLLKTVTKVNDVGQNRTGNMRSPQLGSLLI